MNNGNYYYSPQEPYPQPPRKKGIGAAGVIGIVIASIVGLAVLASLIIGGLSVFRLVGSIESFITELDPFDTGKRKNFDVPDTEGKLPFPDPNNPPDSSGPSGVIPEVNPGKVTPAPSQGNNTDLSDIKIGSNGPVLTNKQIYKKVAPSVVGIVITDNTGSGGSGSGIILTENGYILTNAHVVDGAATITVTLYDGSEYGAVIIGSDATTDVAVIQIQASGLHAATFGNSDNMEVGEDVIAIGNPLGLELSFTMTRGIVSAINRNISISGYQMTLIQTDASINPGNSGGPLINNMGEVIGITSAKIMNSYSFSSVSVEGIGFAIPINTALDIARDLAANGRVTGRAFLGITIQTQYALIGNRYGYCVVVMEVVPDGPGAKAGLQIGDVITSFNGVEVSQNSELLSIRDTLKPGDVIDVVVNRAGKLLTLKMTLGES